MYGVPVCECKANIKPRWIKDGPPVLVCARCGKCVPGYEQICGCIGRECSRVLTDRNLVLYSVVSR